MFLETINDIFVRQKMLKIIDMLMNGFEKDRASNHVQTIPEGKNTITLFRWLPLASLFLLLVFGSCEYETMIRYNMGNDFLDDPTRVMMIDTVTVNTFTILGDTVATSRINRLLSGLSKDLAGVETYAEGYFRIEAPYAPTFHESAKFDSAHFVFYYDGYWHGDTTKPVQFNVYYLDEDIVYNDETNLIYSNKKLAHKTDPITSFTVDLNRNRDSIIVPIPSLEAQKYYDMVRNNLTVIQEPDSFKAVQKDFHKPATNNPSL